MWNDTSRVWRYPTFVLILALTLFRIVWLANFCPVDLAPDEAHYWDWSRHPALSYYSKGPLIAWLIRASCEVLGDNLFAVRLPSILCGALLLVGLHTLTRMTLKSEKKAFLVVLFSATLPVLGAGSVLMTIDSPFVCLWVWALVTGYRAITTENRCWWLLTGLLVGLGILAKYTMALWLFSLGLFLLFTPEFRRQLQQVNFLLMVAVAFACCLPILIWNIQNDFVTFRHVAVQAGVPTGGRNQTIRWFGPLEYVGGQLALLLGYWFVAWVSAMVRFRPNRETNPAIRYLWWMSLPTFGVFGLASIRASGQLNWPVAAYLSGIILTTEWICRQLENPAPFYRGLARVGLVLACLLGVTLLGLIHDASPARPLMAKIVGPASETNPFPMRKLDPTCRLRGWKYLAGEVDQLRREAKALDGEDPILAGWSWTTPGELGFYCEGNPTVYSMGLIFGDRHSQYDLWKPNPISDAQVYNGRSFIFVGQGLPDLKSAFESVSEPRVVIYRENGQPIAGWTILVARNFRGFPADAGKSRIPGF